MHHSALERLPGASKFVSLCGGRKLSPSRIEGGLWGTGKEMARRGLQDERGSAAGRFGFQKDMGAIASLWRPESEANHNVRALLESTEEVVARTKTFMRWWQLWRPDVVAGWVTLGRFKACFLLCCSTCHPSACSACSQS